jgi:hypothetical protein
MHHTNSKKAYMPDLVPLSLYLWPNFRLFRATHTQKARGQEMVKRLFIDMQPGERGGFRVFL